MSRNLEIEYDTTTQDGEVDTTAEILANEVTILADSVEYDADGSV